MPSIYDDPPAPNGETPRNPRGDRPARAVDPYPISAPAEGPDELVAAMTRSAESDDDRPDEQALAAALDKDQIYGTPVSVAESPAEPPPPARKVGRRGCGCGGCLLMGCGTMFAGVAVLLMAGGYACFHWSSWARTMLADAVEQSELAPADKHAVKAQIERVFGAYDRGEISNEQLVAVAEAIAKTPLVTIAVASAVEQRYIRASGLSAGEKREADRNLRRVARGVFDRSIPHSELDAVFDYISTQNADGQRAPKPAVSDDDLRAMIETCRQLADQRGVPAVPEAVEIGQEVKRAVDTVLGESVQLAGSD